MDKKDFISLKDYKVISEDKMIEKSEKFYKKLNARRSVRDFSSKSVPQKVIENCIMAAGTAPSGANMQPWHFVVVSNLEIKRQIRIEAEKEEKEFYKSKAPQEWLNSIKHLGTDEHKPFLEEAPYLIVVFSKSHEILDTGTKVKQYYVKESVGLATGNLISAVHNAGLVSLTHTPSPMNFLNKILGRPENEKPFLILVVGYPKDGATVPNITRKKLSDIATFI